MKILIGIILAYLVFLTILFWPEHKLGSISVVTSSCQAQNGVFTCMAKIPLAGGTTTPCSIQSPEATSSVIFASIDVATSTSRGNNVIEIGIDPTPDGTTTVIAHMSIPASAKGSVVATSSLWTNDNDIISPRNYVNVKWEDIFSTGTGTIPIGTCEAVFRVL